MSTHIIKTIWLNENEICTIEHLSESSGLSLEELQELIDSGILIPTEQTEPYTFHLQTIVLARTARRLRDDFDLNPSGMALAINLLKRIRQLEQELSSIKNDFENS